jgi:uncharacterized protein (DUF2267 family)
VTETQFLELVEHAADITPEAAREAVRATLSTLAKRITHGQAEDLSAFIPVEFRDCLTAGPHPAEPFGVAEFVRRVAAREGVDGRTAMRHVRAIFVALGRVASPDALSSLEEQLSNDFGPLLELARRRAVAT